MRRLCVWSRAKWLCIMEEINPIFYGKLWLLSSIYELSWCSADRSSVCVIHWMTSSLCTLWLEGCKKAWRSSQARWTVPSTQLHLWKMPWCRALNVYCALCTHRQTYPGAPPRGPYSSLCCPTQERRSRSWFSPPLHAWRVRFGWKPQMRTGCSNRQSSYRVPLNAVYESTPWHHQRM